jgi:Fe-S cluster biogenesis protein NfuA
VERRLMKTINIHKLQLQFDADDGDMERQAVDVVDRINSILSMDSGQVSNAQLVMHRDEVEVEYE